MKKLLFTIFLVVSISVMGQEKINWITLEDAVKLQKQQPKKIIMDFYTVWCGPCKLLDKNTFSNNDVAKYINEHFYAVKFNAEGDSEVNFKGRKFTNPRYDPAKANKRNYPHQLSQYFKVNAYPTVVFLDEEGNLITQVKGYQTPQQIELYLKMFANNDYLNIKTQEEFQKYYEAFQSQFK